MSAYYSVSHKKRISSYIKSVKCVGCGCLHGKPLYDPFRGEVHDDWVEITVCDDCYQEIADEI